MKQTDRNLAFGSVQDSKLRKIKGLVRCFEYKKVKTSKTRQDLFMEKRFRSNCRMRWAFRKNWSNLFTFCECLYSFTIANIYKVVILIKWSP